MPPLKLPPLPGRKEEGKKPEPEKRDAKAEIEECRSCLDPGKKRYCCKEYYCEVCYCEFRHVWLPRLIECCCGLQIKPRGVQDAVLRWQERRR